MILYSDEIYSTMKTILKECQAQDTTNYSFIPVTAFENILWNFEKNFYEGELEIIKPLLLEKLRKDKDFKYKQVDEFGMPLMIDIVVKYRAEIVAKGLIENDRNKLESYLMTYFEEADTEKKGVFTQQQLLDILKKCPKLTLTELEVDH
jgi:hypothetical protein